jgi:hypothetical protein
MRGPTRGTPVPGEARGRMEVLDGWGTADGRDHSVDGANGNAGASDVSPRARHLDDLLEEALIGSFPASDPPAIDVEDRADASLRAPSGSRTGT